MKEIEFHGFGYAEYHGDELPVLVFEVEMHEGYDPTGSFQYQFAAARLRETEKARFVLATPDGRILAALDWTDPKVRTLVDRLIADEALVAAIDYEDFGWEEFGGYVTPILGRHIGQQFDVVERYDLDPERDVGPLRDIRTALNDEHRIDQQRHDELSDDDDHE